MGKTVRKNVTRRLLLSLLAAGTCVTVAARPASPGEGQPASAGRTETEAGASLPEPLARTPVALPGGASGMVIHIDPQPGALLKEPAPGTVPLRLTPQLLNALSTSHQGLVEVPIAVPGGGVKVDLQGRFQNPFLATIESSGKLKIQHLHDLPNSPERE